MVNKSISLSKRLRIIRVICICWIVYSPVYAQERFLDKSFIEETILVDRRDSCKVVKENMISIYSDGYRDTTSQVLFMNGLHCRCEDVDVQQFDKKLVGSLFFQYINTDFDCLLQKLSIFKKVGVLNCNHSNLKSFPYGFFEEMKDIQMIMMIDNQYLSQHFCHDDIAECEKLFWVFIDSSNLEQIPPSLLKIKGLGELDITNAQIEVLENTKIPPNIHRLNISGNCIRTMSDDLFQLSGRGEEEFRFTFDADCLERLPCSLLAMPTSSIYVPFDSRLAKKYPFYLGLETYDPKDIGK